MSPPYGCCVVLWFCCLPIRLSMHFNPLSSDEAYFPLFCLLQQKFRCSRKTHRTVSYGVWDWHSSGIAPGHNWKQLYREILHFCIVNLAVGLAGLTLYLLGQILCYAMDTVHGDDRKKIFDHFKLMNKLFEICWREKRFVHNMTVQYLVSTTF